MVDLATTTKQFLRMEEVEELFDVSERTLYYWIESGKLPCVHIGASYRIPVASLRKLMPPDPPDPSLFAHFLQSPKR